MTSTGTVLRWDADQGWGVIDSEDTPGGCWSHWSALRMDGYRELFAGEAVVFAFEVATQDGFSYRATDVGRPGELAGRTRPSDRSIAYDSSLRLNFDDER